MVGFIAEHLPACKSRLSAYFIIPEPVGRETSIKQTGPICIPAVKSRDGRTVFNIRINPAKLAMWTPIPSLTITDKFSRKTGTSEGAEQLLTTTWQMCPSC
jgi:hypothetical protein